MHEVVGNNGYWPSRVSGFQQSVRGFVVLIYMSDECHFPAFSRDGVFITYFETFRSPTRVMYFAAGLVEGASSGGCACIGAAVCFWHRWSASRGSLIIQIG